MAFLNRYSDVKQVNRTISIDALNQQHAKALAVTDVETFGDSFAIKALGATKTADNVGTENGQTLDRFDVNIRFRANVVVDAEDMASARSYADYEIDNRGGINSKRPQGVTLFLQEKTGIA